MKNDSLNLKESFNVNIPNKSQIFSKTEPIITQNHVPMSKLLDCQHGNKSKLPKIHLKTETYMLKGFFKCKLNSETKNSACNRYNENQITYSA